MRYSVGKYVLDLREFELRNNDCLISAEPNRRAYVRNGWKADSDLNRL